MISEQEAREAAQMHHAATELAAKFEDGSDAKKEMIVAVNRHRITLARFAVEELARRESERAERAKPIDDEWFYTVTRGRKDIGPHCRDTGDLVIRETIVKAVTTRGQLLDLLKPLKGEPA